MACCAGRRRVLRGIAGALLAGGAAPTGITMLQEERRLALLNTHTGERLVTVYWSNGQYDPAELARLDWIFRDHRTSAVLPIDPRLFDLLHELAGAAGVEPDYEIISGYRSPATNAMLAARSGGVSTRSLHLEGKAIDVRHALLPLATLRDHAVARRAGGVGYYPGSDFLHLDVGRVRSW